MKMIWDGLSGIIMAAMIAIPLWMVKVMVIALFIGLAVWALSLSKEYALRGAPDKAWWRDVRIWAVIVIGLEIIPYLFF